MRCEWKKDNSDTAHTKVTAYADWLEQIRPDHLKHRFPIIIKYPPGAIFAGLIEFPHFRPVYVYVKGVRTDEVIKNAESIRKMAGSEWPLFLLGADGDRTLRRLIAYKPGDEIPEVARYLFLYDLERMDFPLTKECDVRRIGPAVPDLSWRDYLSPHALQPDQCASPATHNSSSGRPQSSPVVTAIIDAEIAIANERFRNDDGTTRIMHFWRQQQESISRQGGLMTGREFGKAEINKMLSAAIGDERRFYELLRSGHYGTTALRNAKGSADGVDGDLNSDEQEDLLWTREIALRLKHMAMIAPPKAAPDALVSFQSIAHPWDDGAFPAGEFMNWVRDNDVGTIASTLSFDKEKLPDRTQTAWQNLLRESNYASRTRTRPVGFRAGHGTHILDLAAGFPPDAAPNDRPIVAVELPDYVIEDTSGARVELFCLMAMRQILHWVDSWQEPGVQVPVVVNISLGNAAGPRNGNGFLERELARLAEARNTQGVPTKLVIAAGNGYRDRLAGQQEVIGTDESFEVEWRVQHGDKSASYLEIRPEPVGDLELKIEAPGLTPVTVGPGQCAELTCQGKPPYGRTLAARLFRHEEPDGQVLTLALAPTLALDAPHHRAPAGTYRLTFKNTGQGMLSIGLGVQRDDTLSGYPLYGMQSYLDHPEIDGFDPTTRGFDLPKGASPVSRHKTLSAYATSASQQVMVVGGASADARDLPVQWPEGRATRYTGAGPSLGARLAPDLAAVSEDGPGTPGLRASGYFSGSSVVFSGTSTAASAVTRRIVDALSDAGADLDKNALLKKLLEKPLPSSPDLRLGSGVTDQQTAPGRKPRRRA